MCGGGVHWSGGGLYIFMYIHSRTLLPVSAQPLCEEAFTGGITDPCNVNFVIFEFYLF